MATAAGTAGPLVAFLVVVVVLPLLALAVARRACVWPYRWACIAARAQRPCVRKDKGRIAAALAD